jgi:poly(3-hydroxybutyrate) depolymerase
MHHGGSGNGGQFLKNSGWREKADEEGFVSVFPTSAMYCQLGGGCENGLLSERGRNNHGEYRVFRSTSS